MTKRFSRIARSFGWGVADQVLSSITNFLLGLLVARSVGLREFGAFSLAYATYILALGAARALALEPMMVRFSTASSDHWKAAAAAAAGTSVALGAVVGALDLGVAVFASGPIRTAFAVLGIALPGLLLQDAWRFSFFVRGRGDLAFWNDFVWAAVLFPGVALVLQQGQGSIAALIGVWAIAGWIAAAVGLIQIRIMPRVDRAVWWLRGQRDLAFRFFGEFVISGGANQLSLFLIGSLTTLADVGRLRAGHMILGPLNVLFQGTGLVAVAETAKLLAISTTKMNHAVRLVSSVLTLGTVGWAALALALPPAVGEALMGTNWAAGRELLVPLAMGAAGFAVSSGPMTGLRALAAARSSLQARILDATATLVLTVLGAAAAGATGAAWGIAIAACLKIANWWWHFLKARSSYAVPSRAPAGDAATLPDVDMPHQLFGAPELKSSGKQ